MKRLNLIIGAVVAVFGISNICLAGGVGTTGAQFLKIDPSARPLGMGGAYSAVVDDSNAVFYNPAGIARLENREVSGTYLKYFQSVNYGSLAAVLPQGGKNVFGIGINYLGVGDIPKRSATDVSDPEGDDAPASTFGAMDTAVSIAYALRNPLPSVLEDMDLGVNLRFIYQTIDEESAFSVMLDIGAFYPVNDKLALALNIQNVGMGVKFKDESDALPLNIKVGAAYKPIAGLIIATDINEYIVDQLLYASVGAEYWIKEFVALRAGYKFGYDTASLGSTVGLSGGFGVRLGKMGLDYAFAPFGDLGDTHRVTYLIKF